MVDDLSKLLLHLWIDVDRLLQCHSNRTSLVAERLHSISEDFTKRNSEILKDILLFTPL